VPDSGQEHDSIIGELFAAHGVALRRYAQRIVRSREAAEDLVQDVFLRLWRARHRVEFGTAVRAYLYLATRTRALNHLRRERNEEKHRHMSALEGIVTIEPALPAESDPPASMEHIVWAIERALDTMPPRQRQVAALRLRHQLRTREIAARLGISPRTVEVHIARATKALRELLPDLLADAARTPGIEHQRPAPPIE
jgi:RNA polymerase sigma-70 factor (ECF subfamily)